MHKHATDYTKPLLADFERNAAALESVKIPNFLADFERNAAALESLKIPNFLADFERNAAAFEETKEHRGNYVETHYDRDLAHRGTEESNHVIDDYNEVIISDLELGKSIFGDGLAFSERNKKIPSNITIINVRQITIGQITQGERIEMKSEVSNSQVGVLNTGEMQAKSITGSISTTADSNQHEIAEALKRLTETVKTSQDISSQRQTEILEQLELLSEQVILAPSERRVGLIKPILSALATALSAGGGSAEIWSQWGDAIKIFFGIHE